MSMQNPLKTLASRIYQLRMLGLLWDVQTNGYKFDVHLPNRQVARRGLLSCLSSLYNPLGFVSPISLLAKQILHALWGRKFSWDEEVTDDINHS